MESDVASRKMHPRMLDRVNFAYPKLQNAQGGSQTKIRSSDTNQEPPPRRRQSIQIDKRSKQGNVPVRHEEVMSQRQKIKVESVRVKGKGTAASPLHLRPNQTLAGRHSGPVGQNIQGESSTANRAGGGPRSTTTTFGREGLRLSSSSSADYTLMASNNQASRHRNGSEKSWPAKKTPRQGQGQLQPQLRPVRKVRPDNERRELNRTRPSSQQQRSLIKAQAAGRGLAPHGKAKSMLAARAKTHPTFTKSAPDLGWYEEMNLKEFFPSEKRDTWSRILTPILVTLLTWIVFISCYGFSGLFFSKDPVQALIAIAARGTLVWSLVAYVYTIYYRKTTRYCLDGFRLILSRGVFKRYTASVFLSGSVQVYVRRTFRDTLFGLYRVRIIAPLSPNDKVTEFRGYTKKTAYALHDWITDQCNRQVFISDDAIKAEQLLNSAEGRLVGQ